MHGFKSAIFPEFKKCQNGTFEPVDEIQRKSVERLLLKHYEDAIY